MIQEIKQNGITILQSEDTISIPVIFNNLIGKNSLTNEDYQAYLKYMAIPMMGFQYGEIELWEDGKVERSGHITRFLLKDKAD